MAPLRLATRGSPLALHQAELVADALRAGHPGLEVEVEIIRTAGDDLSAPLDQIGGQGVFVTAIEAAVAEGRADAAVHSAKDMTSTMAPGLVLAAVPPRADPRDGLVGSTLAGLPPGGLVATGSARRRAQLAYARPDLSFTEIRGNMARRVSRGEDGSVAAVVVAVAAMERLGWMHRLTDILDPLDLLPQAGQGAIAVQCRSDDTATRALLSRHRRSCVPSRPDGGACRVGRPGRQLHRAGRRVGGARLQPRSIRSRTSRSCVCTGWWRAATGVWSSG